MKFVAPIVWIDRMANASADSILVSRDEVEAVIQRLTMAEEVVRLADRLLDRDDGMLVFGKDAETALDELEEGLSEIGSTVAHARRKLCEARAAGDDQIEKEGDAP